MVEGAGEKSDDGLLRSAPTQGCQVEAGNRLLLLRFHFQLGQRSQQQICLPAAGELVVAIETSMLTTSSIPPSVRLHAEVLGSILVLVSNLEPDKSAGSIVLIGPAV